MKKIALLGSLLILGISPVHAEQNNHLFNSYHQLYAGIVKSNVYDVVTALRSIKGPINHVAFGNYEDSALMLAVRVYCQRMLWQSRSNGNTSTWLKFAGSLIPSLTIGCLSYWLTENQLVGFAAAGITFPIALRAMFSKRTDSAARIVEIILYMSPNVSVRNKEGLTALDILRAYYEVANYLQDENWFRLLHLLSSREELA